MGLFRFDTPQKVMQIGHLQVGGQPGERPPVLNANMFQIGHKIVESRKPPRWGKAKALDEIKLVEAMSNETGIPAIIGIVAPTPDEIKAYTEDKRASGRLTSLRKMLTQIEGGEFNSILMDTTTMNLPTQGFCYLANRMVKEEFGLPTGNAPANGSYMWKSVIEKWGRPAFQGMDAAMHGIAAVLWNDWMAYGPITGTRRVFTAVAAAVAMVTVMAWDEGLELPENPDHPLNKHFPKEVEFMKGLRAAKSDRLMEAQKAKGEKRRASQEAPGAEAGTDLIPESAAAIQPD